MTKLQGLLIAIAFAVLFQVGSYLAVADADEVLADPVHWAIGLAFGVINAAGTAVIAWKTRGGLSIAAEEG